MSCRRAWGRVGLPLALLFCGCAAVADAPDEGPGALVIVGGGLSGDNAEVWGAFVRAARDAGPIVIVPAASGAPVAAAEAARADGGGMALPGQRLEDVLGEGLVDNAGSRRVERLSFDGEGRAVGFVFTQSEATRGWWGRSPEGVNCGRAGYAVEGVGFAIWEYEVELRPDAD